MEMERQLNGECRNVLDVFVVGWVDAVKPRSFPVVAGPVDVSATIARPGIGTKPAKGSAALSALMDVDKRAFV